MFFCSILSYISLVNGHYFLNTKDPILISYFGGTIGTVATEYDHRYHCIGTGEKAVPSLSLPYYGTIATVLWYHRYHSAVCEHCIRHYRCAINH
ncbi:hypothetical protein GJ744_006872 [Endocarpon pusillum]|uniref:Secreted protein n=1 Tax=Endocarpon pusillum TaxID=364733 RepID=A0A8H7DWQ1_9EURO|nr:hypothetical protein GJ744_006872 [Endocarpon pusillum]